MSEENITRLTIRMPYLTSSELDQIIRINQAVGLKLMNSKEVVRDSTPMEMIQTLAVEKWTKENPPENGFICSVGDVQIYNKEALITVSIAHRWQ